MTPSQLKEFQQSDAAYLAASQEANHILQLVMRQVHIKWQQLPPGAVSRESRRRSFKTSIYRCVLPSQWVTKRKITVGGNSTHDGSLVGGKPSHPVGGNSTGSVGGNSSHKGSPIQGSPTYKGCTKCTPLSFGRFSMDLLKHFHRLKGTPYSPSSEVAGLIVKCLEETKWNAMAAVTTVEHALKHDPNVSANEVFELDYFMRRWVESNGEVEGTAGYFGIRNEIKARQVACDVLDYFNKCFQSSFKANTKLIQSIAEWYKLEVFEVARLLDFVDLKKKEHEQGVLAHTDPCVLFGFETNPGDKSADFTTPFGAYVFAMDEREFNERTEADSTKHSEPEPKISIDDQPAPDIEEVKPVKKRNQKQESQTV